MPHYDVVILGAGAAGMMAAIEAGRRGRSVLVVDHAKYAGEKIRISGGGRCNFTNINATIDKGRDRFVSANPRFALSALSRYTPEMFIAMVKDHGISFHEKTLGQLFCDGPATQINTMLLHEMRKAGVTLVLETSVEAVDRGTDGFSLQLSTSSITAESLIVATGGKSIPKMGASGLGYQLASQFGLRLTETRPGLVPLTFETGALEKLKELSGIATDAIVSHGRTAFEEALLFTHRGLSGPAILQISSYWREGDTITVDLLPHEDAGEKLRAARKATPKLQVQTVLGSFMPKKLAQLLGEALDMPGMIGDFSDKKLAVVEAILKAWTLKPVGSEGYRTAEVTLGGVDTRDLDAKTMGARDVPGLYFVGEVVDVTGWLGGYNFQWAWASGWAAGQVA
ncbi:NAD(P)/FAD-dependent oxidoreductase [Devosia neptuniae]|jgi:predicted Rossmann fold flavoprotein|uniref:NAD(P)/FAD-dependent oxidoreductase n=1 Tax=Devosia TaxID=46913 RepID=UPI0022AEE3AD|nr:NAD(P)/FAD-dependent oxidoreductase [Devosia neptuniae]MCZ4347298.1 NAD(P)/FAD-dependent oxidoreductase [Devosia neptuniae]|tara:strand:- start:9782 stop:10972 length:1191 start_codon:yes stop_codon:yes gene_type:complete